MNGTIAIFYVSFKVRNKKNPTIPIKSVTSKEFDSLSDMKN